MTMHFHFQGYRCKKQIWRVPTKSKIETVVRKFLWLCDPWCAVAGSDTSCLRILKGTWCHVTLVSVSSVRNNYFFLELKLHRYTLPVINTWCCSISCYWCWTDIEVTTNLRYGHKITEHVFVYCKMYKHWLCLCYISCVSMYLPYFFSFIVWLFPWTFACKQWEAFVS